jgi:cyclic AMP-dependent transcription factor ATF-2
MENFRDIHYDELELDVVMESELPSLYGTQDGYSPSPISSKSCTTAENYIHFTPPLTFMPTSIAPPANNHANPSSTSSALAASASITKTEDARTVFPSQRRFESCDASPQSLSHRTPNPYDTSGSAHSVDSWTSPQCSNSSQTSHGSYPADAEEHSVGRKRRTKVSEPGSARAIYLEKNRKAARKCRDKQKKQQEDLVAETRDTGLRNRVLKTEVEMLRGNLNALKEIVGLHSNCLDSRLTMYVQREADRLADGNTMWSPISFPANVPQEAIPIPNEQ